MLISPCVLDVVSGYNGTVFAYGQTGSGKTYTMMVWYYKEYHSSMCSRVTFHNWIGIRYRRSWKQRHYPPYRRADLYKHHGITTKHGVYSQGFLHGNLHGESARLVESYVIYLSLSNCIHLFIIDTAQHDNLPIHEDKVKGVYVKGVLEVYVSSTEEVYEVMRRGSNNRVVAYTSKYSLPYRPWHQAYLLFI